MIPVLTIAASVLPTLLLMWLFHRADRFPEPPRLLWGTFGLGVLAILPAAFVETRLCAAVEGLRDPVLSSLFCAFVVAALVEEVLKLSVIRVLPLRRRAFDESMDGIVYGVAAALGFATLENILYVAEGGLTVALLRGVLSVPGHAAWGALLGFYAGRGVLEGRALSGSLKGLSAAVLLHGLYDFPVMLSLSGYSARAGTGVQVAGMLGMLVVSVSGWIWVIRLVRRTRRAQKTAVPSPEETPVTDAVRPAGHGGRLSTSPPSPAKAILLMVPGGLLALAGGLMTVGVAGAVLSGKAADPASAALGGLMVGVMPLTAGILMFRASIRMLNRRSAAPADGRTPRQ